MKVTFLGSGSAYPTPGRGASCTIFRYEERNVCWMFDCGEGSQIQLMRSRIRPGKISKIFVTHLHGDHIFGLPGLLCTISQNFSTETKEPVEIFGPTGLRKFIRTSLQLSRSPLGFNFIVHELEPLEDQLPPDWTDWEVDHVADDRLHPNEILGRTILANNSDRVWNIYEGDNLIVKAGSLSHRIPCFGYTIEERPLPGRLDSDLLKSKGVKPGPLYARIKAGESITLENGETIHPNEVLGPPRPGRKLAIFGDTRNNDHISSLCSNLDLLVHEATLDNSFLENALEKGHSTPDMAGSFARSVNTKHLVLTHYSQRYKIADATLKEGELSTSLLYEQAKAAFNSENITLAEDFTTVHLANDSTVTVITGDLNKS